MQYYAKKKHGSENNIASERKEKVTRHTEILQSNETDLTQNQTT